MKKLGTGILTLALALTGLAASAQTAVEHKEKTKVKGEMVNQEVQPTAMPDGYMMVGGKMMRMTAGKPTPMTEDVKLTNGSTVMRDGTLRMADGSTRRLNNGDRLDMQGTMSHDHAGHQGLGHGSHGEVQAAPEKGKLKVKEDKMKVKGPQGDTKVKKDNGELKMKDESK